MDARQTLDEVRRLGIDLKYDKTNDLLYVRPKLQDRELAAAIRRHKHELVRIAREERGAFQDEPDVFEWSRERLGKRDEEVA